jgi:2'-5' RNA ligase
VPADRVPEVERALTGVPTSEPFTLRLAGSGTFGPVLWAGVAGDVAALVALREAVRVALDGFPIDDRPFQPHLTVSYRPKRGLAQALEGYAGPSWAVTEFALVQSAAGEYHRLQTWQVGAA